MRKILVFLLVLLLLAGCASEETGNTPTTEKAPSADVSVEETLAPEWEWLLEEPTGPEATKAVLELTEESIVQSLEFYFLTNRNENGAAYMDSIAETRSFQVTSFSQVEDVVTAEMTVTIPDVYAIVKAMDMSAYATDAELDAALCDAIKTATPQQKPITVQFTAGGNRWLPVLDDAAADACYGGLLTYLQEATEGVE